jgi:hypothetical protein
MIFTQQCLWGGSLLTNIESLVRARLSIWVGEVSWDPEDERGPLIIIQSSLAFQQTI